ncbi:MAG: hypothetical protein BECKG1743D_GA0114223_100932 [Candidatus Kentron sp. G]|nr:MAG: hypothetical protein BECKG1743E_GA0114224_100782 [Candidatus Kentron sp. G]VFM98963.1 MAG: hypothetical protein BECKG1743D_GA0114223_100932 [Candidatus Kentron sp. G]
MIVTGLLIDIGRVGAGHARDWRLLSCQEALWESCSRFVLITSRILKIRENVRNAG